jgi:hypothetical protein
VEPPLKLWIYRPTPSQGARELLRACRGLGLPARRLRRDWRKVQARDAVISWGFARCGEENYTAFLNRAGGSCSKYQELCILAEAGVPVPEHTSELPTSLGWLGRKNSHHSGSDIGCAHPDFWTREVQTKAELRIHVWRGKSIRAGLKVPTPDCHPRIRSRSLGWRIDYGMACQRVIRDVHREAAKVAVAALGLDFGAVDCGILPSGQPLIFEVNSAPGLEPITAAKYAAHIKEWFNAL